MLSPSYILAAISLLATIFGIWDIKKSELKKRKIVIKSTLTIMAIGTLIATIWQLRRDKKLSLLEADERHRKDSITISMLTNTQSNTTQIKRQADSIINNLSIAAKSTLMGFEKTLRAQQNATNETIRLQQQIPGNFLSSFNILFHNSELYQKALSLSPNSQFGTFFMNNSIYQKTGLEIRDEFKEFDAGLTKTLKDFVIRIWFKKSKTGETLLAGDNILDLTKILIEDEYQRYGTIDKFRPFGFLKLDANQRCFHLHLLNIPINILYKGPEVISISDLEGSTLYISIGYKNSHMKDLFYQDGPSDAEKMFSMISIQNFYLNTGLHYRAAYRELKDSKGIYVLKKFSWKDH